MKTVEDGVYAQKKKDKEKTFFRREHGESATCTGDSV
jgi:hypothetical protein